MHGRPRQKAGPADPERVKAAAQKVTGRRRPRSPPSSTSAAAACHTAAPTVLGSATHLLPTAHPPFTQGALFGQLAGEVLARRAAGRADAESLGLAAKLLELHPEVYTVWNYRREALAPVRAAGRSGG